MQCFYCFFYWTSRVHSFQLTETLCLFCRVNAVHSYKTLSGTGVNTGAARGTFAVIDNCVIVRYHHCARGTLLLAYLTADTAVCANGSCDLAAVL